MKEIIVFAPLDLTATGGLQNHATQWNKEMEKRGFKITVFYPPSFELVSNWPVPKLWLLGFWQNLSDLPRGSRSELCVVTRTRFFAASLCGALYAKWHRLPHLHIEHGADFVQAKNPLIKLCAWLYDQTFGRLVFNLADIVIANSEATKQFVEQFRKRKDTCPAGADRRLCGVEVIYRGVDHELINSTPAAPKQSGDITITYLGRLIGGKGIEDLMNAASDISTKPALRKRQGDPVSEAKLAPQSRSSWRDGNREHAKLQIIGSGPLEKKLKSLAANQKSVTFLGAKSQAESIALLKASDIVVNPSYTEGLPSSVIEAALCGKAIIATNVGGTPEIVQHEKSGLLVKPGNVSELASAMKKLITDPPLRAKLGAKARQANKDRFKWERSAAQYHEILDNLTTQRYYVSIHSSAAKPTAAHFISELNVGGAEKQLALLVPELQKNLDNHVICAIGHGPIGQQLESRNIQVHYLNAEGHFDPTLPWRLYKTLRQIKPDIVITYLIFADLTGRVVAKFAGVKKIICSKRSALVGRRWVLFFDWLTKKLVTHYIVQTNHAKQDLAKTLRLAPRKISIIPNAVAIPNSSLPIKGERIGVRVLCISNLKPHKGLETLLNAIAISSPPDNLPAGKAGGARGVRVKLAGTGPLESKLKQQAQQLDIVEQVNFLGLRTDISTLLSSSQILVHPSEGEGMSNAILEAMAAGVPVIASNIPANRALIEHNKTGLLFEVGNAKDLSTKLNQLLADPYLQTKLATTAQDKIKKDHSASEVVKKWYSLLS